MFHDVSFGFVPVTGSTWPGSHAGNPGAGDDGRIWRDGGHSENLHDNVLALAALHINSILLVWSKAPQEGLWQDGCCDDASDCYLGTSKFCSLVHLDSHSLIAKSVSARSICKCFVQFIFCVCAAFVRRWAQAWYSAHARKQTCKQLNFQP